MSYRLFVAIDFPQELRRTLGGLAVMLRGARRVSEENLHLTLRFIGAADEKEFLQLKNELAKVVRSRFPLQFAGTGCFPSAARARVLWAGFRKCGELLDLQGQVEDAVRRCGYPPEEKRFSPHLTLARLKDPSPEGVRKFLELTASFAAPPVEIAAFHLYSSRLSPHGPTYTREATWPLP